MTPPIYAADLFAGAGGTSTGLVRACRSLRREIDLLAVNHWEEAICAHESNYPWARHLHSRIESVRPETVVPGRHLDAMVASPECTFFSVARGGRPINDQRRASPWHVLPWLQELDVEGVLIENVPEFRNWGPLLRCAACGTADTPLIHVTAGLGRFYAVCWGCLQGLLTEGEGGE